MRTRKEIEEDLIRCGTSLISDDDGIEDRLDLVVELLLDLRDKK